MCVFHVIFLKGDRIQASIGKSVLHLFKKQLNELGLYVMANFIVCQNKEKFKTTQHNLRLTFTQRTTVAEISDPLFPINIFHLRSYDQLINKVDVDETELFGKNNFNFKIMIMIFFFVKF